MSSNDEFQDRLRRIQGGKTGDDSAQTGNGFGEDPDDDPRPKLSLAILKTVTLAPSAGVFALMALFGFGALAMAYNHTRPSPEEVARLDTTATFVDERSFFDRVIQEFFTPIEAPGYKTGSPIYDLPPAPDGWVRVTEADIQAPDPLGDIAAQWPTDAKPIAQNLGYDRLTFYLKYYATPDIETQVKSRSQTRALYFNPNGDYFEVYMQIRRAQSAMGAPNDPAAWTATLIAEAEENLGQLEELETVTLAGLDVVNRAAPRSRRMPSRLIADDLDSPTGMKLAVALNERAELQITGFSTPRAAETLIASFDRPALAARVAER